MAPASAVCGELGLPSLEVLAGPGIQRHGGSTCTIWKPRFWAGRALATAAGRQHRQHGKNGVLGGPAQAWLLKRKTGDISMSSPILPGRFHFAGALHGNPLIYMLRMLPGRSHLVGALPGNPHSTCYSCYLDPTPVSVLPALPSQELRFHMHECRGARVASRIKNCSSQRTPRSVAPACARTDLLGDVASRTANCQDSERELAPATPRGQK